MIIIEYTSNRQSNLDLVYNVVLDYNHLYINKKKEMERRTSNEFGDSEINIALPSQTNKDHVFILKTTIFTISMMSFFSIYSSRIINFSFYT